MPYVNIKVTGGSEAPNAEQKAELIRGVTELLSRVLNKNPETTVVVIARNRYGQLGHRRQKRDGSPCRSAQ